MRSLWRRFMAWWNADDVAEALTFGQRQFGRVYLRDGRCLPVIEGYSLEAAQRHLEILKEIGASPEAIDLAEQVYEAYQIALRPPVPLDAVEREALNRTPYMGAESFSTDLHMWEGPGWDYVRAQHAKEQK